MRSPIELSKHYKKVNENLAGFKWKLSRGQKKFDAKLRDGNILKFGAREIGVLSIMALSRFKLKAVSEDSVSFIYGGRLLVFHGYQYGALTAAFHDYSWLDVKGKRVLDVGANIGDTAVYFGLSAKEVVAFEPYPFTYALANKNIRANAINNVRIINAGVGKTDGEIVLTNGITTARTALRPSENGVKVKVLSLDNVIAKYGPFDAMKMDCEGCEYDALMNSKKIGQIRQIEVEYHYGPERIANRLIEEGFDVKIKRPKKLYLPYAKEPNTRVGYVYAKRDLSS
ncbi:MAG: FkbM family methyltransferase [Thermoprotei archaeon]